MRFRRCFRPRSIVLFLLIACISSSVLAAPAPLRGDTDGDGDVDFSDLQTAITHQTPPNASGSTLEQGDVDGDGDVDFTDFYIIIRRLTGPAQPRTSRPNIVMIYVDDMGYGDVGAFGADDVLTPNLDHLASHGVMLNHCYNSSSACSTSRAALLTGSYHSRVSIHKVFSPGSNQGLNPDEITIAELLQGQDYETGMVGKWHLGHPDSLMPYSQGFDYFYGIPVSHDYKNVPGFNNEVPLYRKVPGQPEQIVDTIRWDDTGPNGEVQFYTSRFTDEAVDFIQTPRKAPFFLYVAYCMPHVALAATNPFLGTTDRGLYGDVMAELDAGIGEIKQTLIDQGIDGDTVIVFASDNGPWLNYGNHAGSSGPLREGKRTVFDGGVRTPCIVYWPGQVPAMPCDAPCAMMDFFATFAAWTGAEVPTDRTIDSVDLSPLLLRDTSADDYDDQRPLALYAYYTRELHAVRMGKWKLVFPHNYETVDVAGNNGVRGTYRWVSTPLVLYDMESDPGETANVAQDYPKVLQMITAAANAIRQDLGDNATNTPPSNRVRPIGSDSGL